MSSEELLRLDYINKVVERRMTQLEASKHLNISLRHLQLLIKGYKDNNHQGLISKRRGKPSNNTFSSEFKAKILDIVISNYIDFGSTLAAEKLREFHDCQVSVETLRKWMIEYRLWVPRKEKLKRAYQPRYRRNCLGELIQIDGSLHHWFEDWRQHKLLGSGKKRVREGKLSLIAYFRAEDNKIIVV